MPPRKSPPSILKDPTGPLRPVDLHVLLTLMDGPCHGYGIVKAIEERTNGDISLVPGNLYPVLNRMQKAGLIEPLATSQHDASASGRQRRNYGVTDRGRSAAKEEAQRLQQLVAQPLLRRLLAEPSGSQA